MTMIPDFSSVPSPANSTVFIDHEMLFDVPQREQLLDRAFGPNRFAKTCERLREGRMPADGLSFVARAGDRVVATLRLWHVNAGIPALMLGPLAVDPLFRSTGLGGAMMRRALADATELGHKAVILVGDAPYYARFGFERRLVERLAMPGPVEANRFLGKELQPGALSSARGVVRATGVVPFVRPTDNGHRRWAA
ncbi:COG3153 Predicted acetyltransferase [Rhabdaerophilaceae bacterium]